MPFVEALIVFFSVAAVARLRSEAAPARTPAEGQGLTAP
jgi:hypothetical protein